MFRTLKEPFFRHSARITTIFDEVQNPSLTEASLKPVSLSL